MVSGDSISNGEKLTPAVLNEIFPVNITKSSASVDLSGAATTLVCLHSERACTIKKATLLYTEASSADAAVAVEIGKESDRNYYYSSVSELSKSQWYTKTVTLLQTDLDAGDTLTFYSLCGKVGTGEIMAIIEYYYTV